MCLKQVDPGSLEYISACTGSQLYDYVQMYSPSLLSEGYLASHLNYRVATVSEKYSILCKPSRKYATLSCCLGTLLNIPYVPMYLQSFVNRKTCWKNLENADTDCQEKENILSLSSAIAINVGALDAVLLFALITLFQVS